MINSESGYSPLCVAVGLELQSRQFRAEDNEAAAGGGGGDTFAFVASLLLPVPGMV